MAQNIFEATFKQIPSQLTMKTLAQNCKAQINHHVFRGIKLRNLQLISMFHVIQQKYQQTTQTHNALAWHDDQKKIYHCFLLTYCSLNFKKILEIAPHEWTSFSELFNNKALLLLYYEAKIIEKSHERVRWTNEEEHLLQQCIRSDSYYKWTSISRFIFLESKGLHFKTPKQCREHWNNHLNKQICRDGWSIEEDLLILNFVGERGRKWAKLTPILKGKRTQHMIKNRFNSMLTCANKILVSSGEAKKSEPQLIIFFQTILAKTQDQQPSNGSVEFARLSQQVIKNESNSDEVSSLPRPKLQKGIKQEFIPHEQTKKNPLRKSSLYQKQQKKQVILKKQEDIVVPTQAESASVMSNYEFPGYMPMMCNYANYQSLMYFPYNMATPQLPFYPS